MFTGLIEKVCTVKNVSTLSGGGTMRLGVDLGELVQGCRVADSIAVNGACLTARAISGGTVTFDVSSETLQKSNLALLKPGEPVNVERPLKPSDRMGGHFVQGHIDGVATIARIKKDGQFREIYFTAPQHLLAWMVTKGSVAVNGVSLTVAKMDSKGFQVAIIPQTLESTTFCRAKAGEKVNIETDLIVKVVRKQLNNILPAKQDLTIEKLQQLGF